MSSSIFWKLHFLDPPSHIQQHNQIDIMFRITNSTLMDRKYPNALAYIKIEAVIRVKQKLWAVKNLGKNDMETTEFLNNRKSEVIAFVVNAGMNVTANNFNI